mmetsp:Transcript_76262/g.204889  ORF Transcript_76262/g.204889 Transcript_76262/m.204889 type:complete len:124 (+) Transcript_76262:368-739(+)
MMWVALVVVMVVVAATGQHIKGRSLPPIGYHAGDHEATPYLFGIKAASDAISWEENRSIKPAITPECANNPSAIRYQQLPQYKTVELQQICVNHEESSKAVNIPMAPPDDGFVNLNISRRLIQ